MRTASLRAVATAAICGPRRLRTRAKNAWSGPGYFAAAQAASVSRPRACARPCFEIGPVCASWLPDWRTRGSRPR